MNADPRRYLIDCPATGARLACVVGWDDLADVNKPETMDEIATMEIGQTSSIGFDERIKRTA